MGAGGHECQCLLNPEEGEDFPEAGVTGGSVPPHTGAENRAQIPCKSSVHS